MSAPTRLHPADLDALADLVAERIVARLSADATGRLGVRTPARVAEPEKLRNGPERLLTAREVAERYGVTPEWVRENAARLGVIRLGAGPRPRLRFDPEAVAATLTARDACRRSTSQPPSSGGAFRKPRGREVAGAAGLLPFSTFNSAKLDKSGGRRCSGPAPAHGGEAP